MKKTNFLCKVMAFVLVLCMLPVFTTFATEPTNETPTLNIHAQSLELESNVYINYYVSASGVSNVNDIELLIWTAPQGSEEAAPYTASPDYTLSPCSTNATLPESESNDTYVKFSFQELAAKQMTDTVYSRAHVKIDNTDHYSDVQKYSILQYAYNKLGKTDAEATENETLKELLNSLLAYGAAAQTHFNYATDNLATDTYYQIKTVGGVLAEDGCDNGLCKAGTELTLTAPSPIEGNVCYWVDGAGKAVGNGTTINVTVSEQNTTYTAVSVPAVTTAEALTNALSGMTENDTVTIADTIAPEANSATYVNGINNKCDFIMTNGGVLTATDFGKIVSNNTGAWATLIINNEVNWPESGDGAYETTVENLTIETNASIGIYAQSIGADTHLNNVTIKNTYGAGFVPDFSGATAYLTNCDISAGNGHQSDWVHSAVMLQRNANVVIYSGSYTGEYAVYLCSTANNQNAQAGTCTIYGGTFDGKLAEDSGELIIYGGTFSADPSQYLAEGCIATKNDDVWVVTQTASSVQSALSGMTENDTVTIADTISPAENSATDAVNIKNKYDFIMTNGGVLTATDFGKIVSNNTGAWATLIINNEVNWPNEDDGAYETTVENLTIETNASIGIYAQSIGADTHLNNVTIKNTYGAGFVPDFSGATAYLTNCDISAGDGHQSDWVHSAVMLQRNANVVIYSGFYTGEYAVYLCSTANNQNAQAGTCTIYGGTFDGKLAEDSGELIIYGGTFTADPSNFLAEGCNATQNTDGWWIVTSTSVN